LQNEAKKAPQFYKPVDENRRNKNKIRWQEATKAKRAEIAVGVGGQDGWAGLSPLCIRMGGGGGGQREDIESVAFKRITKKLPAQASF